MEINLCGLLPIAYHPKLKFFIVTHAVIFYSHVKKRWYTIPRGFTFDGASSPWFGRPFVPIVGRYMPGVLIHDYLVRMQSYHGSMWTCKEANQEAAIYHKLTCDEYQSDKKLRWQVKMINLANKLGTEDFWDGYMQFPDKSIYINTEALEILS